MELPYPTYDMDQAPAIDNTVAIAEEELQYFKRDSSGYAALLSAFKIKIVHSIETKDFSDLLDMMEPLNEAFCVVTLAGMMIVNAISEHGDAHTKDCLTDVTRNLKKLVEEPVTEDRIPVDAQVPIDVDECAIQVEDV